MKCLADSRPDLESAGQRRGSSGNWDKMSWQLRRMGAWSRNELIPRQWLLAKDGFAHRGHFAVSRGILGCRDLEGGCAAGATDAVEHPVLLREVPHRYLAPNARRTELEKP